MSEELEKLRQKQSVAERKLTAAKHKGTVKSYAQIQQRHL